jgi:NAD(P)-dependent dehydrogenase (short-subunit alcohol dehydrogenase family)
MMRLSGKKVLVTGGDKGIGKGIAMKFASEDADLVITYCSDIKSATQTVQEIKQFGVKVEMVQFNLLNGADAVSSLFQQSIDILGRVDILVNNACFFGVIVPFLEVTQKSLEEMLLSNLVSTIMLTQKVCANMVENTCPGCIINISSTADRSPSEKANRVAYEMVKSGISMFTKSIGIGMAKHGIRANAIAPGLTATEVITQFYKNHPEVLEGAIQDIPLRRIGLAEDYQEMALAMALSTFMTGEIVAVDGGASLL